MSPERYEIFTFFLVQTRELLFTKPDLIKFSSYVKCKCTGDVTFFTTLNFLHFIIHNYFSVVAYHISILLVIQCKLPLLIKQVPRNPIFIKSRISEITLFLEIQFYIYLMKLIYRLKFYRNTF